MEKPLTAPLQASQPGPLLARIETALPELRKSEKAVAAFVLAQPAEVLRMSIAELALRVGVSQPTVARFAAALGFGGFREFKLQLAQSLAAGVPYVHRDVGATDSLGEVSAKVFDRSIGALLSVRNHLDPAHLTKAVHLLSNARRLEFYGVGNSGIVALDAQHKFFRFGTPAVAHIDPHTMGMAASLLGPGDAVLAISATGRTTDLLSSVQIAREAGADVIAISPAGSPLARLSSVVLNADLAEDLDMYAPMTSRLAHLVIIDVLAVGVALSLGPELVGRLQRAKQTLRDRRLRTHES